MRISASIPLDPRRFHRVDRILATALESSPEARPALLEELCACDGELRREVEELLAAEREVGSFLAEPLDGCRLPPGTPPGTLVGKYRLLDVLGEGGTSVVYRARAEDAAGSTVAVKVGSAFCEPEQVRRFRREQVILSSLEHPGIARCYGGGETTSGQPFLVVELVDGVPIDRYCDQHRLTIPERLELFQRVSAAVGHIHRAGVIHRDVKPSNVLVTDNGETKLLDFGIAKPLASGVFGLHAEATRSGARQLTPGYASPEQIDNKILTPASDVYSLGVLLFRLLVGSSPYCIDGERPPFLEAVRAVCEQTPLTLSATLDRVVGDTRAVVLCRQRGVPSLAALRLQLTDELEHLVAQALAKDPRQRQATASDLAAEVRAYLRLRCLLRRVGCPEPGAPGLHRLATAVTREKSSSVVRPFARGIRITK